MKVKGNRTDVLSGPGPALPSARSAPGFGDPGPSGERLTLGPNDAVAATGDLHLSVEPSTAADILWTLGSPEVHQQLTIDRNWSNDDYRRCLTVTVHAVLLR